MRLFHYTIIPKLPAIEETGAIIPATAGVPEDEKPIVWCSLNQEWEETANKMMADNHGNLHSLTKRETHELGGGLARIEVDPKSCPLDWKTFKATSGVQPKMAAALYETAIKSRSRPGDWRGSYEPIGREHWVCIEVYDGEKWRPYTDADKPKPMSLESSLLDTSKPISLDAFFEGEGREITKSEQLLFLLNDAEVVIGVDAMTEDFYIVFGREKLAAVTESGGSQYVAILQIGIDADTEDLEKLCYLMLTVKGSCDVDSDE